MSIFIGRQEELDTFKNSFETISKENSLISFGKKAEKNKIPQIFLFDGEGGFGKTTLTNQCIDIAREATQKKVKVVKIDFHNYFLQQNAFENNSRKLISAFYSHLVKDESINLRKYFIKYEEFQEKIEKAEEKAEKAKKEQSGMIEGLSDLAAGGASMMVDSQIPGAGAISKKIFKQGSKSAMEYGAKKAKDAWEKKLDREELDLYKNSDKILTDRLAEGLIKASQKHPLLLVIDTFEEVDNEDIDSWLFTALLKAIYENEEENRLVLIISGRKNHRSDYIDSHTDRDLLYHKTLPPFTLEEAQKLAQAYQLDLEAKTIADIHKFTSGIPLVLENVFQYIADHNPNIQSFIQDLRNNQGNLNRIFSGLVKRFLRYCESEEEEKYVYYLALMLDWDIDTLSQAWECSSEDCAQIILSLAEKHSFIDESGKLHAAVKEYLRKHLLVDKLSRDKVKTYTRKLSEIYAAQLKAYEEEWTIDERYEDKRYIKVLISYINALLWYDQDQAFKEISKYLLEVLQFNFLLAVPILSMKLKDDEGKALSPRYGIGEHQAKLERRYKDQWENYKKTVFEYLLIFFLKQLDAVKYRSDKDFVNLKKFLENLRKNIQKLQLDAFQQKLLYYYWAELALWTKQKDKASDLLLKCKDYFEQESLNRQIGVYFFQLGTIFHLDEKNYKKAEELYGIAIEKEIWVAYVYLGFIHHELDAYPKAEEYYQKAIEKEVWWGNVALGFLYENYHKEYPKAEEYYQKAIEQEVWQGYDFLGDLYRIHFKEYSKAEEYYQKAIEKEVWRGYIGLGKLHRVNFKEYSKAAEYHQKAVEKEVWDGYVGLGLIYKDHHKEYSKAEDFFQKALEKEEWVAYRHLADLYQENNQPEKAHAFAQDSIQKMKELLAKEPKNGHHYMVLAALHAVLDDRENFYQYLQQAVGYGYEMDEDREDYPTSVQKYFEEEEFQALLTKSKKPIQ